MIKKLNQENKKARLKHLLPLETKNPKKIFSLVSAILINNLFSKELSFILFGCFLLSGCIRALHVKHNLAEGQITDLAIIRKSTGIKTKIFLPIYEDFLEGYLRGGLFDSESQPIQGVAVKVVSETGADVPEFVPGITDGDGVFKIRFSVPIRWNRINFSGAFSCSNWKIINPQPKFLLYFNRDNGVLAYSLKETWLTVKSEQSQEKHIAPSVERKSPEKKKKDFFENFGFGP